MIIVTEDMYRLFKTAVFQKQALIGEKYWRVYAKRIQKQTKEWERGIHVPRKDARW